LSLCRPPRIIATRIYLGAIFLLAFAVYGHVIAKLWKSYQAAFSWVAATITIANPLGGNTFKIPFV
jgi:hypothetical protein